MERSKIDHQVHNYIAVNCNLEIQRLNNVKKNRLAPKTEHKDKDSENINRSVKHQLVSLTYYYIM